jgi:8-amino-7-oxononanoate synthase
LRNLVRLDSAQGPRVTVDGKPVVLLCSNNYLGIAEHPALKQAACDAMERYGFGSGASRLVSGNTELHEELERRIAAFKLAESAILFNSGYAANTGIIPAVAREGDLVLSDQLNHASIIDGCRLSRARTEVFRHRDMDHLETHLRSNTTAPRKLIITDGVFSMDGDIAPLPEIAAACARHGAFLAVDDAHGLGVIGARGRGSLEHFGLTAKDVPALVGTLGKGFGTFGAFIAGDGELIETLVQRARTYIYTTALPVAVAAATRAALAVSIEESWRRERVLALTQKFRALAQAAGLPLAESMTPIQPVLLGHADAAVLASRKLLERGFFVAAIRPPTVPDGTSRLRVTLSAAHRESDVETLVASLAEILEPK